MLMRVVFKLLVIAMLAHEQTEPCQLAVTRLPSIHFLHKICPTIVRGAASMLNLTSSDSAHESK